MLVLESYVFFVKPGRGSGHKWDKNTCDDMRAAAERDGLVWVGTDLPTKDPEVGHYVSLHIWANSLSTVLFRSNELSLQQISIGSVRTRICLLTGRTSLGRLLCAMSTIMGRRLRIPRRLISARGLFSADIC